MWDIETGQWAIVLAGVSDFARPAKDLSLSQNLALTATGAIWTRWCFIIKPKNMLYVLPLPLPLNVLHLPSGSLPDWFIENRLAGVNFLLCCVGVTQVTRIVMYESSVNNSTLPQVAEADAKDGRKTVKGVVEDPEGAARRAKKV